MRERCENESDILKLQYFHLLLSLSKPGHTGGCVTTQTRVILLTGS